jgi:hypothetical protein
METMRETLNQLSPKKSPLHQTIFQSLGEKIRFDLSVVLKDLAIPDMSKAIVSSKSRKAYWK